MPKFILLETSTSLCSAAVSIDGKIVSSRRSDAPRAHASLTAVFVKEMLDGLGMEVSGFDAVCISSGPGSYTGLRVASSSAKGLCFGAGIPLISVNTPQLLAFQAICSGLLPDGCTAIVPLIDARRMEVYTSVFSPEGEQLKPIEAKIIDAGSFDEELSAGAVLFIGDGAGKCSGTINHPNAKFIDCCPEARYLQTPAVKAFNEKRFENTAYFEPFYLKEFIATTSRKNLFQKP